jgi:ribonuclease HI
MIEIYTDGSADVKSRDGGWAYVLTENGLILAQDSFKVKDTTNNRMELTAALEAILALSEFGVREDVSLFTDSNYLIGGASKGNKRNVNNDLWDKLDDAVFGYSGNVHWKWVKGHSGNKFNEIVDKMASYK